MIVWISKDCKQNNLKEGLFPDHSWFKDITQEEISLKHTMLGHSLAANKKDSLDQQLRIVRKTKTYQN